MKISFLKKFSYLRSARAITRRYFITNGFDGALTMLGLLAGFYANQEVALPVAITACLGAAVALLMSGLSSAYLSETAERKKELAELQEALLIDLHKSDVEQASRYIPILVALVNGLAPLLISLIIILPLWLANQGVILYFSPFLMAIVLALVIIFFLGVFLGSISKTFWLWAGLRALLIALLTMIIIFIFSGNFEIVVLHLSP